MGARRAAERKEERERERLRQEKKLAKEKRREEAKQREMLDSRERMDTAEQMTRQINGDGGAQHKQQNGNYQRQTINTSTSGFSCFGFLFKLILFLAVGCAALSIALIWVYTGGKMDSDSIQRAVPIIQRDVEKNLVEFSDKTHKMYTATEKKARPYIQSSVKRLSGLMESARLESIKAYDWVVLHYGDTISSLVSKTKELILLVWSKCEEALRNLIPLIKRGWDEARPYLQRLGALLVERMVLIGQFIQTNYPVYLEWLTATGYAAYQYVQATFNTIVQAMN